MGSATVSFSIRLLLLWIPALLFGTIIQGLAESATSAHTGMTDTGIGPRPHTGLSLVMRTVASALRCGHWSAV